MRRYGLVFLCCIFWGWVFPMCGMQDVQNPQTANGVQIFLTVSAKDQSPVPLEKSQFSVLIDKKAVQVIDLRPAKDEPLLFAVLVDISKSDAGSAEAIKSAVLQVFKSLSGEHRKGYIVVFNHLVAVSRAPVQVQDVQPMLEGLKFGGGTAVYDAIERICTQELSRSRNPDFPRRVVILISDGEDNSSHIGHARAEAIAEEQGMPVFSLQTHSALAGPRGEQFLKAISHNTGGQYLNGKNVLEDVPPLIAAIDGQWSLSFAPPQSRDNSLHSLILKTSQKNIRVTAPAHIFIQ